jgi:hypothetical protein
MVRLAAALIASLVLASSVSAQIVYEPVKFQYDCGANMFFYGGSNPAMLRYARRDVNIDPHRIVTEPLRVYSDRVQRNNAAVFGYTAADAYNEAHANLPGYYRKIDLLRAAHLDCDGTLVVPADAGGECPGTIDIKRYTHRPTTSPNPVIVIPKRLLDKPLAPEAGRKVVLAEH